MLSNNLANNIENIISQYQLPSNSQDSMLPHDITPLDDEAFGNFEYLFSKTKLSTENGDVTGLMFQDFSPINIPTICTPQTSKTGDVTQTVLVTPTNLDCSLKTIVSCEDNDMPGLIQDGALIDEYTPDVWGKSLTAENELEEGSKEIVMTKKNGAQIKDTNYALSKETYDTIRKNHYYALLTKKPAEKKQLKRKCEDDQGECLKRRTQFPTQNDDCSQVKQIRNILCQDPRIGNSFDENPQVKHMKRCETFSRGSCHEETCQSKEIIQNWNNCSAPVCFSKDGNLSFYQNFAVYHANECELENCAADLCKDFKKIIENSTMIVVENSKKVLAVKFDSGSFGDIYRSETGKVYKKTKAGLSGQGVYAETLKESNQLLADHRPSMLEENLLIPRETESGLLQMDVVIDMNLLQYSKQNGGLSPAVCLKILFQVCSGLNQLHKVDLVHCDIKPDNIGVCNVGSSLVFKLIDFDFVSRPGTLRAGSNGYAAPEVRTPTKTQKESDIWALGFSIYSMRFGREIRDENKKMLERSQIAKRLRDEHTLLDIFMYCTMEEMSQRVTTKQLVKFLDSCKTLWGSCCPPKLQPLEEKWPERLETKENRELFFGNVMIGLMKKYPKKPTVPCC